MRTDRSDKPGRRDGKKDVERDRDRLDGHDRAHREVRGEGQEDEVRGVVVGEAAVLQRREVAVLIDVGPPSRQERREVAGHELHEGPAQRDGDQTDDHVGEAPDRDDAHGDPSDQEKSVPPTSYGSPPKVGSQS